MVVPQGQIQSLSPYPGTVTPEGCPHRQGQGLLSPQSRVPLTLSLRGQSPQTQTLLGRVKKAGKREISTKILSGSPSMAFQGLSQRSCRSLERLFLGK